LSAGHRDRPFDVHPNGATASADESVTGLSLLWARSAGP
jgi:hypothetical protein